MPVADGKRAYTSSGVGHRKRKSNMGRAKGQQNPDDIAVCSEDLISPISSDSSVEAFEEGLIPTEFQNLPLESAGTIRCSSPIEENFNVPTGEQIPLLLEDWWKSLNGNYSLRMNDSGIGGCVMLDRQNGMVERASGTWILNSENEIIGGPLHRRGESERTFSHDLPSPIKEYDYLNFNQMNQDLNNVNREQFTASEDEASELEDPPSTSNSFKPSFNSTLDRKSLERGFDPEMLDCSDRPGSSLFRPCKHAVTSREDNETEDEGPFQLTKMVEELTDMMQGTKKKKCFHSRLEAEKLTSGRQLQQNQSGAVGSLESSETNQPESPSIWNRNVEQPNSCHDNSKLGNVVPEMGASRNPYEVFAKMFLQRSPSEDGLKRPRLSPRKPPVRVLFPDS